MMIKSKAKEMITPGPDTERDLKDLFCILREVWDLEFEDSIDFQEKCLNEIWNASAVMYRLKKKGK
mgnify:FL=1